MPHSSPRIYGLGGRHGKCGPSGMPYRLMENHGVHWRRIGHHNLATEIHYFTIKLQNMGGGRISSRVNELNMCLKYTRSYITKEAIMHCSHVLVQEFLGSFHEEFLVTQPGLFLGFHSTNNNGMQTM